MKKIWRIEDLDDIRRLQQSDRPLGDDEPFLGPIEINSTTKRIVIENEFVQHNISMTDFLEMLAEACGVKIVVT